MPIEPNNIPTILIIDDEPFNLEFLAIVLKQQGYNVLTALTGRSGRNLAELERPDLILLDIMMPGENGFECAAVLRLSPETSEIPIIFLTALDDLKNTSRGFDAGAVDFIIKPFEYKEVLHRIRLHLLLAANEKKVFSDCPPDQSPVLETEKLKREHKRSIYPSLLKKSDKYVYETINLAENTEGHLLLSFSTENKGSELHALTRQLLAESSGPLYTPATTMRDMGAKLQKRLGVKAEICGIYAVLNRETEKLVVVNAGALPLVFMQHGKSPQLIERQSGSLGSLGLGLPPCATHEMQEGSRLFMFTQGMLSRFRTNGEAIKELREACELSAGVDIETSCQAAGEMLQQNGRELEGLMIAIEG